MNNEKHKSCDSCEYGGHEDVGKNCSIFVEPCKSCLASKEHKNFKPIALK